MFGSDHAGVLAEIASEDEVRTAIPGVFQHIANYDAGDKVPAFVHNGNSLGYTLFDCPDQESYQGIVRRLREALHLVVT